MDFEELRLESTTVRWETIIGEEHKFQLLAENISSDHAGVHCRIKIGWNGEIKAWGYFNVEREADRTNLFNKGFDALPTFAKNYFAPSATNGTVSKISRDHYKHEFDLFCLYLWPKYVETMAPKEQAGSLEIYNSLYILKPYIQEGAGTILFGPPGRGKSYIEQIWTVAMDGGYDGLWQIPPHKTLLINLERSERSVLYRLARINMALGFEYDRPLLMLNARGRTLADIRDIVKMSVEENGVEVVSVDSISRAGVGDLTGNREANGIIDMLNRVAPTWFAIGHSPRGDDSHVYGGIHFDAGADIMIQLSSENSESSLGISLQITKANDIAIPGPEQIALDFDPELGLTGIRRPKPYEYSELDIKRRRSLLEEIIMYLQNEPPGTPTDIANALERNRGQVSSLLNHRPEFVRLGPSPVDKRSTVFGLKAD